jgi:hypothetical protein
LDLVLREDDTKHSSSSSSTITVALELPDELPSFEDEVKTPVATVQVRDSDLFLKEEED